MRASVFSGALLAPFSNPWNTTFDNIRLLNDVSQSADVCEMLIHWQLSNTGSIPIALAAAVYNEKVVLYRYIQHNAVFPQVTFGFVGIDKLKENATVISNADDLIAELLSSVNICKVMSLNSKIYYGMWGMILDENFCPLLTLNCQYKTYPGEGASGLFDFKDIVCVVDQSVFANQSDPVNKCIIQKVIPCYMDARVQRYMARSTFMNSMAFHEMTVCVRDNSQAFMTEICRPGDMDVNEFMQNIQFKIMG